MDRFRRPVAVAAMLGFAASLVWHIVTLLGHPLPSLISGALFVGIFVVFFPTVLYLQRFNSVLRGGWGIGGWNHVFRGAPVFTSGFQSFMFLLENLLYLVPVLLLFMQRHSLGLFTKLELDGLAFHRANDIQAHCRRDHATQVHEDKETDRFAVWNIEQTGHRAKHRCQVGKRRSWSAAFRPLQRPHSIHHPSGLKAELRENPLSRNPQGPSLQPARAIGHVV